MANTSSTDSRPLLLITSLIRALAHKIRTPLSVVVNDLEYLKAVSACDDYERILRRARDIADVLRQCTEACSTSPKLRTLRVLDFLHILTLEKHPFTLDNNPEITTDPAAASNTLRMIQQLIAELRNGTPPTPDIAHAGNMLHWTVSSPLPIKPGNRDSFESITAFVCEAADLDHTLPALIDAMLWNLGASIHITQREQCTLCVRFPLG
jgi:signal transduction histidine kinase